MYLNERHVYIKGIGRVLNFIKMILNHISFDGFYNINFEGSIFSCSSHWKCYLVSQFSIFCFKLNQITNHFSIFGQILKNILIFFYQKQSQNINIYKTFCVHCNLSNPITKQLQTQITTNTIPIMCIVNKRVQLNY